MSTSGTQCSRICLDIWYFYVDWTYLLQVAIQLQVFIIVFSVFYHLPKWESYCDTITDKKVISIDTCELQWVITLHRDICLVYATSVTSYWVTINKALCASVHWYNLYGVAPVIVMYFHLAFVYAIVTSILNVALYIPTIILQHRLNQTCHLTIW